MSDLFDDPRPGANEPEFTVTELSGAVRRVIEGGFGHVRVRGEVGRVVRARSGHLYFDLKDDKSVLSCMTWRGQVPGLGILPEEGMEVVAEGKMTASGMSSKYGLNAVRLAVAGEGALMAMLERRKKALAAEGLFDAARKKPLPFLPEVIGVVTSPQGAVIRDILHRLRDRFPRKVLVWPVAVQGKDCAPQVAAAIAGFNALTPGGALPRPDLLIVARGGGSVEDLWGFNEEVVARAAAASAIPLISAVGHETDTTLIDFVSDRRAPTPTAAAEMAVPVRLDLLAHIEAQEARLAQRAAQGVSDRRQRLADLSRGLPRAEALFDNARQRFDMADRALPAALRGVAQGARARFAQLGAAVRPAALGSGIVARRERLLGLAGRLGPALERLRRDEVRKIAEGRARLDGTWARMAPALARLAGARADRLDALDRMRRSLGYEETLGRGYAVVWGDGALVTSAEAARAAGELEIQFRDGRMRPGGGEARQAAKPAPKPKGGPEQGSLF